MRLWHKDLVQYLPKKQLIGQWRECCCIAKNISEKRTPNHILVNKIMDYEIKHFIRYSAHVAWCMVLRGYRVDFHKFGKYFVDEICFGDTDIRVSDLFPNWHNDRYLKQCLYNLQEKYDCGGIEESEWTNILKEFGGNILE